MVRWLAASRRAIAANQRDACSEVIVSNGSIDMKAGNGAPGLAHMVCIGRASLCRCPHGSIAWGHPCVLC